SPVSTAPSASAPFAGRPSADALTLSAYGMRIADGRCTKCQNNARRAEGGHRLTYSNRSLHGQVAHDIGAQILRGDLGPGDVLPNEADFSARLKVSRTALREAIKVLAAKGLVESRPKTGTRVRPRGEWNLLDPDVLAWQLAAGPVESFVADLFELRQ